MSRFLALCCLVLLAAGCGGDDTTARSTATSPTGAAIQTPTDSGSQHEADTTPMSVPPGTEAPADGDGRIVFSVMDVATEEAPLDDILPDAPPGRVYLTVRVSVDQIDGVHLTRFFQHDFDDSSFVTGGDGQTYEFKAGTARGLRFTDPDSYSSPSEIVEGGEGLLVFEVPPGAHITSLTLVYSYRADWDETSPAQRGQAELPLDFVA